MSGNIKTFGIDESKTINNPVKHLNSSRSFSLQYTKLDQSPLNFVSAVILFSVRQIPSQKLLT